MKDLDIRRDGTVYHTKLKRFLKLHDNGRGYLCFSYKSKTIPLHRAVAEKFCKRAHPSNNLVLHKNHKKHDCRASNLKWGTHSENLKDAYDAGTMKHSRKGRSIEGLSVDGARRVWMCYSSINEAATHLGTSRANIGSALKGKSKTAAGYTWRYV